MIPGWIDIAGVRIRTGDSEVIKRMEIVQSYGFVADGFNADLDFEFVRDTIPGFLRSRLKDRVLIDAFLSIEDGPIHFRGYLEEPTGSLSSQESIPGDVNVTARSLLSLLQDDTGKNRMTISYVNETASKILMDVVKMQGFALGRIDASEGFVGEGDERQKLFSRDDELPGAIIEDLVSATGYVANTDPERRFHFLRQVAPPEMTPPVYCLRVGDPSSDIFRLDHVAGSVSKFSSVARVRRLNPGWPVMLYVEDDEGMSRRYFVTQSRYQSSRLELDNFQEHDVALELPDLKEGRR